MVVTYLQHPSLDPTATGRKVSKYVVTGSRGIVRTKAFVSFLEKACRTIFVAFISFHAYTSGSMPVTDPPIFLQEANKKLISFNKVFLLITF
jgi:hypothetical protein